MFQRFVFLQTQIILISCEQPVSLASGMAIEARFQSFDSIGFIKEF